MPGDLKAVGGRIGQEAGGYGFRIPDSTSGIPGIRHPSLERDSRAGTAPTPKGPRTLTAPEGPRMSPRRLLVIGPTTGRDTPLGIDSGRGPGRLSRGRPD